MQFFVVGTLINKQVFGLGGSELVPIDAVVVCQVFGRHRVGFGVAIIEETFVVVFPCDTGESAPF